jgi:hypothetical protein
MSRERRRLFQEEESPAEPGRFGCPMLTRGHRSNPIDASLPLMRCSNGWAVHGELEIQRCLATDAVMDCWKVHPERTPIVVLAPTMDTGSPETEQKASAD